MNVEMSFYNLFLIEVNNFRRLKIYLVIPIFPRNTSLFTNIFRPKDLVALDSVSRFTGLLKLPYISAT